MRVNLSRLARPFGIYVSLVGHSCLASYATFILLEVHLLPLLESGHLPEAEARQYGYLPEARQ